MQAKHPTQQGSGRVSRTSCCSIPDGPFLAVTLPSLLAHEREHTLPTVPKVREKTPCLLLRQVCSGSLCSFLVRGAAPSRGAGVPQSPHRVLSLPLSPPVC